MAELIERRYLTAQTAELRATEGGDESRTIGGYAALYDTLSDNLGGFREKIEPGAFEGRLQDDVRALFNHESSNILGRNGAGTLRLGLDERGLKYDVDLPSSPIGDTVWSAVERGDIDQSSFGFVVDEDRWDEDDEGRIVRTIIRFRELFDVSPVTFPAYPDATVDTRGLERFMESKTKAESVLAVASRSRFQHQLDLIRARRPVGCLDFGPAIR